MLNRQDQIFHDRLLDAAYTNDVSTIKEIILQLGERGNLLAVVNAADQGGDTALILAASCGHTAAVTALLAISGINVDAVGQFGDPALTCAASNGYAATVQALLAAGANVNVATQRGNTALILAAAGGRIAVVQVLLAVPDINLDAQNNNDRTAAEEAERYISCRPACRETYNLIMTASRARRASAPAAAAESVSSSSSSSSPTTPSFEERLAAIPDFDERKIPPEFIDPISQGIMNDPVTVNSGINYDRKSLVRYFAVKGNCRKLPCPMTRFSIRRNELTNKSNVTIRSLIEKFVSKQEAKYRQQQEQAAAASSSNDEATPNAEKIRAARLKIFGGTLPASEPVPSLAAQAARPAEQDDTTVVDRRP